MPPNLFDPRRLQLLVELQKRGSVAAVAEALGYSPSAISHQLSQLEHDVGMQLTEKVGRRLILTEAGARFAGHGAAVFAHLEEILAQVEISKGGVVGTFRIGSIESVLRTVVSRVLASLATEHPGLKVACQEIEVDDSIVAVVSGELDLAVVESYAFVLSFAPPSTPLSSMQIATDPLLIALPESHAHARKEPLLLGDLRDEVWIAPAAATPMSRYIDVMARQHGGYKPDVVHRTNNLGVAQQFVAAGHGVTVAPRLGLLPTPGIVFRTVSDVHLSRTLHIVTRESSSDRPALSVVIAAILDAERAQSAQLAQLADVSTAAPIFQTDDGGLTG